jgi:hypothetical protein
LQTRLSTVVLIGRQFAVNLLDRRLLPYIALGAIVLGACEIAHLSRASEAWIPARAKSVVDIHCQLPAKERAVRLSTLQSRVKNLESQVSSTQNIIDDYSQQLAKINRAYLWSRRAMTVATVASVVTGAEAAYESFWLARGFTLFRFSFSVTQARAIVATSLAMRALELPEQVRFIRADGIDVDREILRIHEQNLETVEKDPFISAAVLRYFTDRDCGPGRCSYVQPQLQASMQEALTRYRDAVIELENTDRWWKPDAFTHLTGRLFGEVHIPWNQAILMIEKMQLAYAGALRDAMVQDQAACDR